MQTISESYDTADRLDTQMFYLLKHGRLHIHHFRPLSPFIPKNFTASYVKIRDLSLKTFCSNVGLPPSLPYTTTIKKDSVYQKKVYKLLKDLNTNELFLFVTPIANHRHFNLFLGSVGSFPEVMNEKVLHFHKVI